MWIIRWAFIAIIIVIVLGFSLQNTDRVTVRLLSYEYQDVPLFLVIYVAFCFGIFVYLLVAIFHQLQLRSEISRLRRENRKLLKELEGMRNLSLGDEFEEEAPAGENP
jgi:uncharacterized integral membrane protein